MFMYFTKDDLEILCPDEMQALWDFCEEQELPFETHTFATFADADRPDDYFADEEADKKAGDLFNALNTKFHEVTGATLDCYVSEKWGMNLVAYGLWDLTPKAKAAVEKHNFTDWTPDFE